MGAAGSACCHPLKEEELCVERNAEQALQQKATSAAVKGQPRAPATPPEATDDLRRNASEPFVSQEQDIGGTASQDSYAGRSGSQEPQAPMASQRTRRASIVGESMDPSRILEYKKPVYAKDKKTRQFLERVLQENEKMQLLIGHIKDTGMTDIVNAFFRKKIAKGEHIIRQGEEGDCLYIVASGTVDVFVDRSETRGNLGDKVCTLGAGALFGELALMYSAPRAATVVAVSSEVILWSLEQLPFRMLVCGSSMNQITQYEGWLADVEILKPLNRYELSRISDLLESTLYTEGEVIITQGEVGDCFYILEDGECAAFIQGPSGEVMVKSYTQQGEYFGELALLNDEPRKATVRATGEGCSVAWLSKDDFFNLLGPIQETLRSHSAEYAKAIRDLK